MRLPGPRRAPGPHRWAAAATAAVVLAAGVGLVVVDALRHRSGSVAETTQRLQATANAIADELTDVARESRTLAVASRGDGFQDAVTTAAANDPAILGAVVLDGFRFTHAAFPPDAGLLGEIITASTNQELDLDGMDDAVAEPLRAILELGELRLAGPLEIVSSPIPVRVTMLADRAPLVDGIPDERILLVLVDADVVASTPVPGGTDLALRTSVRFDGGLDDLAEELTPSVVRGDPALFDDGAVASTGVAGVAVEVAGLPASGWPMASPATPLILLPTLAGAVLAFLVVDRRRTERLRLEHRVAAATSDLQHARARERATIDHSPDGLLDVDDDVVVSVNAAGCALLGRPPADVVGQPLADLLGAADVLDQPASEVRVGERLLQVRSSAVPSGLRADVGRRVVTLHDVTADRRSAELLLRYTQKLEQVNAQHDELEAVRSDLLAKVSHELRTPLTVIGGVAELLRRPEAAERQGELLDAMTRQLARLTEQVEGLLEVAEGPGHHDLEVADTDLADVARAVTAGLDVTCVVSGTGIARISGAAATRILRALVTNAITYGAPPIDVTIGTCDGEVVCDVLDVGAGVPVGTDPFAPFAQGTSGDRRTAQGLGMGLPMARGLAHTFGGELELVSENGPTVFRLRLPSAAG